MSLDHVRWEPGRLEDLMQALFVLVGSLRRATETNLDELSSLMERRMGLSRLNSKSGGSR